MILGNIKDIKRYLGINKNLDSAINFILCNDLSISPLGITSINDNCYLNIMEYSIEDSENTLFECHKLWGDIHLCIKGEEAIAITDLQNLNICEEYNEEKDIMFGTSDDFVKYKIDYNHFAIVFNDDPHKVKVFTKDRFIKKAVFKFKI